MGGGFALFGGFRNTVCSGGVIGSGLDDLGSNCFAKSGDTIVIGCDNQLIQSSAEGCSLENVLEEWFSQKRMKRLSGEAGGGPAGRDDANDSCFFVADNIPPQSVSGS